MRRMQWGTLKAEMDDEGKWECPDRRLATLLNQMTDTVLANIGPADGEPMAVAFNRVAQIMKPDQVTVSVPQEETEERVY